MKRWNLNKVKKMMAFMLAVLVAAVAFSACRDQAAELVPDDRHDPEVGKATESEQQAENPEADYPVGTEEKMGKNAFDDQLMAFLDGKTDGNYMASPLSFRYALGLLIAGASGETKTELLKALGVESEEEWTAACLRFNAFAKRFQETFDEERKEYEKNVKSGGIPKDSAAPVMALRVANSVWKNEKLGVPFTDEYCENVSKNYDAEYESFTPENAAEKINDWVNRKTESMIDRLLPDGYDASMLAVVLMNALYFKDAWWEAFLPELTETGDFHTKSGAVVQKEFMHDTGSILYYEDENTRLVVLPMKGGVDMAFVLGDATDIAEKINAAEYRKVKTAIPKLDLETSFSNGEFVDFLKENGVRRAFDPENAEFSRMIDTDVYVDDIIQKTRIKLNEDGVEAAAVTAIMMCGSGYDPSEPVDFTLDQPFSFFIYTDTGSEMMTMFAGRIVE